MTRPGDVVLRAASEEDLDEIVDVFLACWRTSYQGVMPDRIIEMYGSVDARALWRRSFTEAPDARAVFVAERADGAVVGVVAAGLDPDEPSSGHIFSLYVHPAVQGTGLGARLVALAVEFLGSLLVVDATLWVFEANAGARRFYARLGWTPDGETRVEPEYGEPEVRLRRSLVTDTEP